MSLFRATADFRNLRQETRDKRARDQHCLGKQRLIAQRIARTRAIHFSLSRDLTRRRRGDINNRY